MKNSIICAGFHRSGTSLASQMLHLSGVPYAIEKMAGNISNADGHFEDVVAMRMHDDFLSESGSTWQFHDECEINHKLSITERIKDYSNCRNQLDGPLWLMKDPRATLYLDDWQTALEGNGKFVLMYRHWGLCIQSLLKRHSQDMAHNLPTGNALEESIAFWENPELAARMWLAYNKAMIKFIRANREHCLVVSQAALMKGWDFVNGVNAKFNVQLNTSITSPVKAEYASETIDMAALEGLSVQLQLELNNTYQQLAQLCDTENPEDTPEFVDKPKDEKVISLILKSINSLENPENIKNSESQSAPCSKIIQLSKDFNSLSFDELLIKFQELKPLANRINAKSALLIALRLIELEPYKIAGHEWAGRIYLVLGQYKNAQMHFYKAIAIGNAPPYMRMLLADTYMARYEFELAEYFYLLAYKGNRKNPLFSHKLADLYSITKEFDKAIKSYEESLFLHENAWIRGKLISVINEFKGTEAAINFTNASLLKNNSVVTKNKLVSLKLKLGTADAKACYRMLIRERISSKDIVAFLESLKKLSLPTENLKQLCYWYLNNLSEIFTEDELIQLFIVQQGKSPRSPKLSIIVICYNMERELPRTIISLLPPYQEGISASDLEVIVVDNGSSRPPVISDFPVNISVRILKNSTTSVSPVSAINLGLAAAKSELIGVLIDGARMASPGLCKHVLKASRLSPRTVISTLGFHLGPEVQMESVPRGYNQNIENQLLQSIDWRNNGYKLFEISSLAGSSARGYFQPIAESNAIFMSKSLWQELGGFDERFITPGGGFVNLDTYHRACELPDVELTVLLNEGTFHQVHGGVATNLKREDATPKIFKDEYERIRQKTFIVSNKTPLFIGSYIPEAKSFLQFSLEQVKASRPIIEDQRNLFNRILLNDSYCKQFETNGVVPESLISSPVIITGRGGSGTRLLSQLMQSLDLFLGNEINPTADSVEWVGPIYDLVVNRISMKNDRFEQFHIERLRANAKNILLNGKVSSGMWGFKLPETMLCLPELLKAFPNAKVIHLTRHPITTCMRRTHMTSRINNPVGKVVLQDAYQLFNLDPNKIANKEDYFNNAVSWSYQLESALNFFGNNGDQMKYLQVKYEDIIAHGEDVLVSICEFLGMPNGSVPDLAIDTQRLNNSAESSKETEEIWDLCQKTASLLGYTKEMGLK